MATRHWHFARQIARPIAVTKQAKSLQSGGGELWTWAVTCQGEECFSRKKAVGLRDGQGLDRKYNFQLQLEFQERSPEPHGSWNKLPKSSRVVKSIGSGSKLPRFTPSFYHVLAV